MEVNRRRCSACLARLSFTFDIDAIKNILGAHAPKAQHQLKLLLDGVAADVKSARFLSRF